MGEAKGGNALVCECCGRMKDEWVMVYCGRQSEELPDRFVPISAR